MSSRISTGTELLVKNPYGMKLGFNTTKISLDDLVMMTAWLERVFGCDSVDKIHYKEGIPHIVVRLKRKRDVTSKLGSYAWAEFITRRLTPRENIQHTDVFLFNRKDVDLEQQGFATTHYPNANANPRNFSVANRIPPPKWCPQPTMWNGLQWAKAIDQRESPPSLGSKGTQLDASSFIQSAVREVRPDKFSLLSLSPDWLLDDALPKRGMLCCRILGTLSTEYAEHEDKTCIVNSVFAVNYSIAPTARVTMIDSDVTLHQIPLEYLKPLTPRSVRHPVVVLRGAMKGQVFRIIGYEHEQCVLINFADDSGSQVVEVHTNNLCVYHPPEPARAPAPVPIPPIEHRGDRDVERSQPFPKRLASPALAQEHGIPTGVSASAETSSILVKLESETSEEFQKRRFDETYLHHIVLYNPIGFNHRNPTDLSQVKAWLQSHQLFGAESVQDFYVRPLYPQIIAGIRTSLSILLPLLGLHMRQNCIFMCPMPLKNAESFIFRAPPELQSSERLLDKGYRRVVAGVVKDVAPEHDFKSRDEALKYVVDDVDPPDLKLWQWTDAERIEDSWGEFGKTTEHLDVVVKSEPDDVPIKTEVNVNEEDTGISMDVDNSIPRIKSEPASESFQRLERPSPSKRVKAIHNTNPDATISPGERSGEAGLTAAIVETAQQISSRVPNGDILPTLTGATNEPAMAVPRTGIFRKSETGAGGITFPLDRPLAEQVTPPHAPRMANSSDPRLRDPRLQTARVRVKEEPMD